MTRQLRRLLTGRKDDLPSSYADRSPSRRRSMVSSGAMFLLVSAMSLVIVGTIPWLWQSAIGSRDVSSRRTSWARTVGAQSRWARARVEAEVNTAERKCTGVLRNAPHDQDFHALTDEIVLTLEQVANGTETDRADLEFAGTASHIQWKSEGLRSAVRALAIEENAKAGIAPKAMPAGERVGRERLPVLSRQTTQFLSSVAASGKRIAKARDQDFERESVGRQS